MNPFFAVHVNVSLGEICEKLLAFHPDPPGSGNLLLLLAFLSAYQVLQALVNRQSALPRSSGGVFNMQHFVVEKPGCSANVCVGLTPAQQLVTL